MKAIRLLTWWQIRNSLRNLFKDPRKLIPLLFMSIPFAFMFMGQIISAGAHHEVDVTPIPTALGEAILTLATVLLGLTGIDSGLSDNLLAYTAADMDYLFPAPLPAKLVLGFRAARANVYAFVGIPFFMYIVKSMAPEFALSIQGHSTGLVPISLYSMASLALAEATFLNVAMIITLHLPQHERARKYLLGLVVCLIGGAAFATTRNGIEGLAAYGTSPILQVLFFPMALFAKTAIAALVGGAALPTFLGIVVGWLASWGLLFWRTPDFYERSVVSTERIVALRAAVKTSGSPFTTARSKRWKAQERTEDYMVRPFGTGGGALFWAHMCAFRKGSSTTMWGPGVLGILIGVGCSYLGHLDNKHNLDSIMVLVAALYASFLLVNLGKVAFRSVAKRRELVDPLPIPGRDAVLANLGIPAIISATLFLGMAIGYSSMGGTNWPLILLTLGLTLPVRFFVRLLLQYLVSLSAPDIADQTQQLLSQVWNWILLIPFAMVEAMFCIPAWILSESPAVTAIVALLIQIPILYGMLCLTGKAAERAVASGEPVSFMTVFTKPA